MKTETRVWTIYGWVCIVAIIAACLFIKHEVDKLSIILNSEPQCYEVVDKYFDPGIFNSHCYLFLRDIETNEIHKVEHSVLYYWVDIHDKVYCHIYRTRVYGCDYDKGDLPNVIHCK